MGRVIVVEFVVPKLVGRGVRLFDSAQVDLRCAESVEGEGAVHLRYESLSLSSPMERPGPASART